MAHFQQDENDTNTNCDLDNKLANGSIWRATVGMSKAREGTVALYGGAGLQVRSNNPTIVNNPLPEHMAGDLRIVKLCGVKVGTTMIEAGIWDGPRATWAAGSPWVTLQVEVKEHLDAPSLPDRLLTLSGQHMALNAPKMPVSYVMKYTRTIPPFMSLQELAATINNVGSLRHLIISAHGQMVREEGRGLVDSEIQIGQTIRRANLDFFRSIRRALSGGVLWLGACAIGSDMEANADRARAAGSYLVAPTVYMQLRPNQRAGPLPFGKVDMYQQFKPVVFDPNGIAINWQRFAAMSGKRLGFKL